MNELIIFGQGKRISKDFQIVEPFGEDLGVGSGMEYLCSLKKHKERIVSWKADNIHFGGGYIWDPNPNLEIPYFIQQIIQAEENVYQRFNPITKINKSSLDKRIFAITFLGGYEKEFDIKDKSFLADLEKEFSISSRNRPFFKRVLACNEYTNIGLVNGYGLWSPKLKDSEVGFILHYIKDMANYINFNDLILNLFFATSKFTKENLLENQ